MKESDVVIRVEGLGKKYSLHHEQSERYTALRDVLIRQAKAAGRLLNPFTLAGQLSKTRRHTHTSNDEEFWALKDVNLEIRRGERVGIIGRNGAGKSTLLKILSRITEPTTGRVEILGRVASLLEVGTGFHPELTGRENIYLNGAILGMGRKEIASKLEEIVEFAGINRHLDTPVKRYSSGMYVRLAFAVAAHIEPEILVIDEVLAVGDLGFQKKCLGKMNSFSDEKGKTVIFVSHNMAAIRQLCNKAILLSHGNAVDQGMPEKIIESYTNKWQQEKNRATWPSLDQCPGDDVARITEVTAHGQDNTEDISIENNTYITIQYTLLKPLPDRISSIESSIHIKTLDGVTILATGKRHAVSEDHPAKTVTRPDQPLTIVDTCHIPANFLNNIGYTVDAIILTDLTRVHAIARDVITFMPIEKEGREMVGGIIGVIRPTLQWSSHCTISGPM